MRGLNIQEEFVKFTGIGVYLEDKAVSSLAAKWKGKSAAELFGEFCCVCLILGFWLQNPPDWQEILTYFRGSELQNYFTRILEDDLKVMSASLFNMYACRYVLVIWILAV